MSHSGYDSYRPPEPRRRRRPGARRGRGAPPGRRGADGSREMPMVDDVQFGSYYGRPVVKAPPWDERISAYMFLGGLAGGSGLLALGAQLTGRPVLRRNCRLTALAALAGGTVALISDLGRPERFHHMLRTFKPASPMNVGSWLLGGFGTGIGLAAACDIDRLTGQRLPLGPLRRLLRGLEAPAGVMAGILAAPVASYTAVLLSDTAVPTWHAARDHLPYVFVSSASMAAGGMAMATTGREQNQPARILALLGVAGEGVALRLMKNAMHPAEREPLETGGAGRKLAYAERLAILGGLTALAAGRSRVAAVGGGLALLAASAFARFGVMEAGIESTKDPRHTIEPQKDRLARRRAAGVTDDSITTAGDVRPPAADEA